MFHSGTTNMCEHLMNRHSGSYKGDGEKKEKQRTPQALAGQSAVLSLDQGKPLMFE